MTTFRDLFIDHVGAALERQLDLEDKIGPCDWHLDLPAGTLSFDTPVQALVVPIQVLGSEAEASEMFIPAWSIDPNKMPAKLAESSRRIRAIGEKDGIPELKAARVPLADADGERFSLVASGLLAAPGYYRAPFRGGAMFILLEDRTLLSPPERPAARVVEVFRRAVDLLAPAEQKRAFAAYIRHHAGKLREEGTALHVAWKDEALSAKVDADGSVYSLEMS